MLIMPLHTQLLNRERRLNVFALVEKQRKRMQTQAPMVSFSECSGELEGKNIPSRKCERDSFDSGCEDISNAAEPKWSESERIYNPGGAEEEMKVSPWRREHMFEKAVTPSDVGKLNRLVIPKQQAEKYLPLDTAANEKGLLLSFEDSTGKPWRFRYSYWNSSQSYVLTKGWNRFVKDKKLDAGDVVSFDRATHQDANLQRLFINYRRKPFSAAALPPGMPFSVKCPLQLRSPFQFPSDAIGGAHVQQQLLSSRALNGGPRLLPLFWPASNRTGESSRGAGETRALHANAQPNDLRNSLRFLTTDKQSRKVIHDSVFPLSIQRLSNSSDCGRPATGTERDPPVHAAIQFESRGISRNDLSRPLENKVSEVAASSFDHCTSKKVVRLFGVDLECGKLYENYEDELRIIPPSEHPFPRNSKCDNLDELLPR